MHTVISQKVFIRNGAGAFLALRRTKTAPTHPLHWDVPGGILDSGEDLREGAERETREETGLAIAGLKPFDAVGALHGGKIFVVTIAYTARPLGKAVTLSYEHDEFRWVTAREFLKLPTSEKLKRFAKALTHLSTPIP